MSATPKQEHREPLPEGGLSVWQQKQKTSLRQLGDCREGTGKPEGAGELRGEGNEGAEVLLPQLGPSSLSLAVYQQD